MTDKNGWVVVNSHYSTDQGQEVSVLGDEWDYVWFEILTATAQVHMLVHPLN